MKENKQIIAWWSGGVTSAVTCKICIDLFGLENCRFIFIDTFNEDDDTYRFKNDCEKWYGKEIETITSIIKPVVESYTESEINKDGLAFDKSLQKVPNKKYNSIQDVWFKYNSLNSASGAVCSSELKRRTREIWQKENFFDYQAFGFEIEEPKRAKGLSMNHQDARPIFPLLLFGYSKKDCIKIIQNAGIEIPVMYKLGFKNNNCFKTGCVQGGFGYWQKMEREYPDKFNEMALIEHQLTALKGSPVTMLKDQSKVAKSMVKKTGLIWKQFVFLKDHPEYPELKRFSAMEEMDVEPLFECNGLCGVNDLSERIKTENEINY